MTKEEKQLLLRDICCRLPYNTVVLTTGCGTTRKMKLDHQVYSWAEQDTFRIMPYLFPMSSMTDAQREEYESLCIKETTECADLSGFFFTKDNYYDTVESFDWLNKNHFDYRGLIEEGLAIDATGKNIY